MANDEKIFFRRKKIFVFRHLLVLDAKCTFTAELASDVWPCGIIDPGRSAQNTGFNYFQLRVLFPARKIWKIAVFRCFLGYLAVPFVKIEVSLMKIEVSLMKIDVFECKSPFLSCKLMIFRAKKFRFFFDIFSDFSSCRVATHASRGVLVWYLTIPEVPCEFGIFSKFRFFDDFYCIPLMKIGDVRSRPYRRVLS